MFYIVQETPEEVTTLVSSPVDEGPHAIDALQPDPDSSTFDCKNISIMGVSWSSGLRHLTVDAKVEGSNPDTALISFGKIFTCTCYSPPRCLKWVPGRMRTFMWLDEQV